MVKEKLIKKQPFKGKIAIICGGSKGMGKETARLFVKLGGSVCIVARGLETLKEAAKEIESVKVEDSQFVEIISHDTTEMDKLEPLFKAFIDNHGTPDYLINVVGYAYPQYIEKLTLEDFKKNMDINYYGQLVPILIVLPYFMEAKKGYIVNFSSMMGYFGIMGYATYAPTKHAIVGLTETLRHELKPYNINFSIVYPPDVDTPGFEEENKIKPKECAMLSEGAKLMQPEDVADVLIECILKKKYNILPGEAKFVWRMFRHFPKLVRNIVDKDYKKARKKLSKN